jgi:DNA-binding Xre family transcriptional regulator
MKGNGDTMNTMPLKWKVRDLLEAHSITPYRLRLESGLSSAVAYGIANGEHQALDMRVMDKLLPALRRLTGDSSLQIGDIVEYEAGQ